jgi:hypothetical protein
VVAAVGAEGVVDAEAEAEHAPAAVEEVRGREGVAVLALAVVVVEHVPAAAPDRAVAREPVAAVHGLVAPVAPAGERSPVEAGRARVWTVALRWAAQTLQIAAGRGLNSTDLRSRRVRAIGQTSVTPRNWIARRWAPAQEADLPGATTSARAAMTFAAVATIFALAGMIFDLVAETFALAAMTFAAGRITISPIACQVWLLVAPLGLLQELPPAHSIARRNRTIRSVAPADPKAPLIDLRIPTWAIF